MCENMNNVWKYGDVLDLNFFLGDCFWQKWISSGIFLEEISYPIHTVSDKLVTNNSVWLEKNKCNKNENQKKIMLTKKSSSLSWGLSVCLSVRQKLPGCEENKLHSNPKPRKTQISPCLNLVPRFLHLLQVHKKLSPMRRPAQEIPHAQPSHTHNSSHSILSSHISIPEEKIQ
jgi:hypothetical protein